MSSLPNGYFCLCALTPRLILIYQNSQSQVVTFVCMPSLQCGYSSLYIPTPKWIFLFITKYIFPRSHIDTSVSMPSLSGGYSFLLILSPRWIFLYLCPYFNVCTSVSMSSLLDGYFCLFNLTLMWIFLSLCLHSQVVICVYMAGFTQAGNAPIKFVFAMKPLNLWIWFQTFCDLLFVSINTTG